MEEKKLNLYEKLAAIRKMTEVIQKNKRGFNYKYTSIEEILARVTAGMSKYNVSLIPMFASEATVTHQELSKTKVDKTGKPYEEKSFEYVAYSPMQYVWVDNDKPEDRITVPWFVLGSQGDPAQAMGSALTYGLRYFLTQYFQIATPEDDPDNFREKQREAEKAQEREIAAGIAEQIDATVHGYLDANPDKRDEVVKFSGKFIKGGNYMKISDPALAAKFLSDFKATFVQSKAE